jgi:hypothetical protein
MIIATKEEMFKLAYTGLQNICRQKKSGSIHNINAIEFSYAKGNKKNFPAILFVFSPSKYYIFAFDDGLIIEYIDNKINVLDFKNVNKEYDVNSNQDVIDIIYAIGGNVIKDYTAYFAQTFFKKKLTKTHSKYLSDNDKNVINAFLNMRDLSTNEIELLYKQVSEILFLRSGNLFINSSQLELDLTELDEYYIISAKSINERKTIYSNREYCKTTDNIYKTINQNLLKFYDALDFKLTINNDITNHISFNVAKIQCRIPFFIPTLGRYIDRSAGYSRIFCVEERQKLNWIVSTSDYSHYIWRKSDLNSNTDSFSHYIYLSPIVIDQLNDTKLNIDPKLIYIVFGKTSANKLVEKINEHERAKVLDALNKYNTNIPTEDEFIDEMRAIYTDLKKSSQIQSYFHQKFIETFKLRFKKHFEQEKDIEVI